MHDDTVWMDPGSEHDESVQNIQVAAQDRQGNPGEDRRRGNKRRSELNGDTAAV